MTVSSHGIITETSAHFGFTGKVWTRIGDLYSFLIFSSLLLSFECVAMAYVSCTIQQIPWTLTIAIIPFLAAFSIYNLNRKTDEDEDEINRKDRFAFTKRYENHLFYGALLALAIAGILSAAAGIPALLATAAPFICGFLYSFRWIPKRLSYRRLKEIPAVKNIVVGFSWATLLAFLPVFLNLGIPDSRTAVIFVLFFMWGFMASVIPDIRDKTGDASSGVMTLPVIFGQDGAKTILICILLILGVPLILFGVYFLPPFAIALLLAANLYSHGCVYLLEKPGLIDFLADAISDGQYICFAVAIIITTQFWQLA